MLLNTYNIKCKTWHDVLLEKGFNSSNSTPLIGFISWNKGEEFTKIGREITEVLSGYEGRLFVKDVVSINYNDKGLMFFSSEIPDDVSNKMFDAIMSYEQNNVYNKLQ